MILAGAWVAALAERFAAAGISDSRFDARLLVAEVLGLTPGRLTAFPETAVSPAQAARLEELAARRAAREPMSHVLGHRGFWTLDLAVTQDTLAPRPDTETLVEAVLARIADRTAPLRLLDLGTGTGCILLALLSELPNATGLGIDRSAGALAVAAANARANHLDGRAGFQLGDWSQGLAGPFDVIVSNPPYIPDGDIDALEPEVARFEPRGALAGGADGLDCYRLLAPQMAALAAPGGIVAFEVGQGQDGAVARLMEQAGLCAADVVADLAGIGRCVIAAA
ncbi:protein-(glutamine-N5) methyltransferase, release factor-specific [Magnetospirillum moscoviense]|uniref:Release factor glutamine methyltransferase n=2 Tax=Magnetospirillum moscoviense TaxID=1437059 RepID=A0A178MLH1_9PROT|nr:peptide chain release factor N(5)-glutamine methyltransferase [Magnetospirillum moscoviense]OAN48997.1 protein-(glutamine-N5) methyltransferase, release factor-specific [Magnetospirillum moscoviense]